MVAGLLSRSKTAFAPEYPSVIVNTRSAPGRNGGLGTGMSNTRQQTPTAKLNAIPIANFMGLLPGDLFRTLRVETAARHHSFLLAAALLLAIICDSIAEASGTG